MKLLEDRILTNGKIGAGDVLKVDSFLNHQIDVALLNEMGKEFFRLFGACGVNKILTVEASGIGVACIAAQYFDAPVVFAKKAPTINISAGMVYMAESYSYTRKTSCHYLVSRDFLSPDDRLLIIDDFLANGCAAKGLIELANQAGATVCGIGIAIEKAYQPGGAELRSLGYRVESLARIATMSEKEGITFC